MKCCTGRCFLITICVLQMLSTIERQVFDFMGYMWALILGNFLQLIFVIMGLFGAAQYRPKFIAVYAAWSLVWLAWNIFIICFYLDVGILSPEMTILDFGVGKKSWWQSGGIGCRRLVNQSDSGIKGLASSTTAPQYTDCLLKYHYVEVLHAGVQCIMALIGFIAACYVIYVFSEEDDSFDFIGGFDTYSAYQSPAKSSHMQLQPMYVTDTN
ncbi:sodium/potassium-transporting ATPase subunit beta-1-interacting protein 3 [Lingula anatina]|uniref:Sodium/potassium-transporting ATPase subunit beta-1-interacting protein n=1 Tax=Lingula anatina TaxID=7574 RepID=A0A1S3JS26_LINAN|nr:sodium/potassium-transporting ATPase subunit beta-1-interacting protein 3 [Lingula anatina]|eukprot:XP_013413175.1 sodium/potassium-transporting ATPase subunit beta-1-interacting protein 3 [Lingula anatina]